MEPAQKRARPNEKHFFFEAGTLVKVANANKAYDTYKALAERLQLDKWQSNNGPGEEEEEEYDLIEDGDVGIVRGSAPHECHGGIVVGLHVPKRGRDYLVAVEGLYLIHPSLGPSSSAAPLLVMRAMWASRESGDVRLVAKDGQHVDAHACVLTAASPVFAAALQSGMRESIMKEIPLPETLVGVVEGVLELLYLGSLPTALCRWSVLTFAHKYNILAAVMPIANELIAGMTPENAANTVRMLRDFGRESTNFIRAILAAWKDDKIMECVLAEL